MTPQLIKFVNVCEAVTLKMDPETVEEKWLKDHYQETEAEGPSAKRVKLETIHSKFSAQFPERSISTKKLAFLVKNAFPRSRSKRFGKERSTYIVGMADSTEDNSAAVTEISETQQLLEANARLCLHKWMP